MDTLFRVKEELRDQLSNGLIAIRFEPAMDNLSTLVQVLKEAFPHSPQEIRGGREIYELEKDGRWHCPIFTEKKLVRVSAFLEINKDAGKSFIEKMIDDEKKEADKLKKDKELEIDRFKKLMCPACKSTDKKNNIISTNNGVFGPGYSVNILADFYICKSCGVHYSDISKIN